MPVGTNATADEIVQQRHLRAWTQRRGPSPVNRMRYAGPDEQYIMFGAISNPITGGRAARQVHDPFQRDAYRIVGQTVSAPDFPSGPITFQRRHGGVSYWVGDLSCPNNFYELAGQCRRPDDFSFGWTDFLTVYSYARANDRTHNNRTSYDADDPLQDEIPHTYAAVYDLGTLSFGENAATAIQRETVDAWFDSAVECGNCGVSNNGWERLYYVTKSSGAGSPGITAEVGWTIDGGATYRETTITGLGVTSDPTKIRTVGNFVVVLDTNGNGYWYAEKDPTTGTPTNWTNVTSGFVAGNNPYDIFVASNSEIWFVGLNGYVYFCSDITAGVTVNNAGAATSADLLRIKGRGDVLLAVGESGAAIMSTNRGVTWFAIATPTSGTLRSCSVLSQYLFWIVSGTGGVWYTNDGGATFYQLTVGGAQIIDDIEFATDEVGYLLFRAPTTTSARLWTTYNGGASWSSSSVAANPRLQNFPSLQRGNSIAVPTGVKHFVAANRVAIPGLSSGGTDGILLMGAINFR